MWNWFTNRLSKEEKERCQRKCGLAIKTLQQCRLANPGKESVCRSLEVSVTQCLCEVPAKCKAKAKAHEKCFTEVAAQVGKNPIKECKRQVSDMEKCLKKVKLWPIK